MTRAGALELCRDKEFFGTGGPCPDATAITASNADRTAMEQDFRGLLVGADLPDVSPGGACDDFLLTSFDRIAVPGNPNGNIILPLDALIRCVASATATAVDRVVNITEPGPLPAGFAAGVAAGDVTETSAILWTLLPDSTRRAVVELTPDPSFLTKVTRSQVVAMPGEDGTVRVEVPLQRPHVTYYYRFRQDDLTSDIGRITRPSTTGRPLLDQPDVFLWGAGTDGLLRPFLVLDPFAWVESMRSCMPATRSSPTTRATTAWSPRPFDDFAGKYRANRLDSALRNLMESTVTFAIPDDREIRPHAAGAEPGFAQLMATG